MRDRAARARNHQVIVGTDQRRSRFQEQNWFAGDLHPCFHGRVAKVQTDANNLTRTTNQRSETPWSILGAEELFSLSRVRDSKGYSGEKVLVVVGIQSGHIQTMRSLRRCRGFSVRVSPKRISFIHLAPLHCRRGNRFSRTLQNYSNRRQLNIFRM
jgi:hypothetical protein